MVSVLFFVPAFLLACAVRAQIACTVSQPLGCFQDLVDGKSRVMPVDAQSSVKSQASCAALCYALGEYQYFGVEFGTQCFCGNAIPNKANASITIEECFAMKCGTDTNHPTATTNATDACGATDRILVGSVRCSGSTIPNYQGCIDPVAKVLPYCDTSKSIDERVTDLVARLDLDEKIASISPQPKLGEACGDHTAGKASIGLPDYFWLTETNTNVAARCYSQKWRCATTFIGPMGMGASFNKSSWYLKGDVLGTSRPKY